MSNWPTATDYRDALQNPRLAFRDPQLQRGTIELNKLKVPRARSGAFANVYKLTSPTRTLAVRVFLYPQPVRQKRYDLVRNYLKSHARGLACLVDFDYDPAGIRIGNDWFPLLTMDWVKGVSLGVWMREAVQRRDTQALRQMADRWVRLMETLQERRLAHGDLQHDNVMIVGDQPILVDYDCMCVPQLVGEAALEAGKPAYQHPKRAAQPLSLQLDHFSAWIILISLQAVASDLSLYERFVEKPKNEALLFCENDILHPQESELWPELFRSHDADVRAWARSLFELLPDGDFDKIPPFSLNPYAAIYRLAPTDWEAIDRAAKLARRSNRPIPPELVDRIREATRRVEARDRLMQALAAKHARSLAAAYTPGLLDNWPPCASLVNEARRAKSILPLLDQFDQLLAHPGDGRQLLQLWQRYRDQLHGWTETAHIQQQVDRWSERLRYCETFLLALHRQAPEAELAAAWEALVRVGGHPDAAKYESRAQLAIDRTRCLVALSNLPDDQQEATDRRWAQLWNDALLKECREADPLRPRQQRTTQRLEQLSKLRQVIQQVHRGVLTDQAILDAANRLPTDYRYEDRDQVAQARKRIQAHQKAQRELQLLRQAASANPCSDKQLADLWDRLSDRSGIDPALRQRCELAVRRRDRLAKLEQQAALSDDYEKDLHWEKYWHAELDPSADVTAEQRQRYQLAIERLAAWRALAHCLNTENLHDIEQSANHPLLRTYPPVRKDQARIEVLLDRQRRRGRIVGLFRRQFQGITRRDIVFLRENEPLFRQDRNLLQQGLTNWLRTQEYLSPTDPEWELDPEHNEARLHWLWSSGDLVDQCWLHLDGQRHFDHPTQIPAPVMKFDWTSFRRGNGISILLTGQQSMLYVTIWPVLDLYWMQCVGKPLHLGPFPTVSERKSESKPRLPWLWSLGSRS